jgi:heterodisulfide reductase subunit C
MYFKISIYVAFGIFGLGMLYRISTWLWRKIGIDARGISFIKRMLAALKGIVKTLFGPRILTFLKALILDVILQRRILKEDFLRWFMHMLIYLGFILLTLMHALHRVLTSKVFPGYFSTLNPYMFLRDLFGAMIIAGLLIALFRRLIRRVPRLKTNSMDIYLIIIIGVIVASGILLEGIKITSYGSYKRMIEEYGDPADNEDESKALEAYWVKEFHVASPSKNLSFDRKTLELGKEVSARSCTDCHSSPIWAFTGYATAMAVKPISNSLDSAGVPDILYWIHYIACLLALAYFPFSKMIHVFTTPVSLIVNAVMEKGNPDPANVATRQALELDACMHCCTCSIRCSALSASAALDNTDILPSEKMRHLKAFVRGKKMKPAELVSLAEGVYVCTNCDRCTVVCPAGINLRELWFQVREDLVAKSPAAPFILSQLSFTRALRKDQIKGDGYAAPLDRVRERLTSQVDEIKSKEMTLSVSGIDRGFMDAMGLTGEEGTFSYCFTCSTCTSSCPVVQNFEKPADMLGLLPHQVIHSTALGLKELALGSRMIWDCLTCYQCQVNCPQGVRVTDVFYKLKNLAAAENVAEPVEGETGKDA